MNRAGAARTPIHDEDGIVLGYLRDLDGGQVGYDRHSQIIGVYDSATGQTFDRNDDVVGSGNLLATMIKRRGSGFALRHS